MPFLIFHWRSGITTVVKVADLARTQCVVDPTMGFMHWPVDETTSLGRHEFIVQCLAETDTGISMKIHTVSKESRLKLRDDLVEVQCLSGCWHADQILEPHKFALIK
jgi:hypothetical protein